MRATKTEIFKYTQAKRSLIYSVDTEYKILMCSTLLIDIKDWKKWELYHIMYYLNVIKVYFCCFSHIVSSKECHIPTKKVFMIHFCQNYTPYSGKLMALLVDSASSLYGENKTWISDMNVNFK